MKSFIATIAVTAVFAEEAAKCAVMPMTAVKYNIKKGDST